MKGHKPTMNDFGSNNLVPHVHVLYLNVGTKWMKNQAWGPNLTGLPTSQVWPMDKPTPISCWAKLLESTYRRWTYGPTIWRSPDLPMDPLGSAKVAGSMWCFLESFPTLGSHLCFLSRVEDEVTWIHGPTRHKLNVTKLQLNLHFTMTCGPSTPQEEVAPKDHMLVGRPTRMSQHPSSILHDMWDCF
jgi:hypothetical protein